MGINIDQITRTKTTIVGDERMVGRDDLGDFKMSVDDLLQSLAGQDAPGKMIEYVKNGDPAVNGDRVILQQGQTVLIADYQNAFDAVYKDQTTPAFFKCDSDGTPNASGLYFIMQDRRGLGIKGIGDADFSGRAKVGPTELSEMQEDQGQGHKHAAQDSQSRFALFGVTSLHNASPGTNGGTYLSDINTGVPKTDGTNGTPRAGLNNRDSIIGTQWGLTY